MSGGHLDYKPSELCSYLFGYSVSCDYGADAHKQSRTARRLNPMEDHEISEMMFDSLCLMHTLEWYRSGDIGDDTYKDELLWFKKKWFKRKNADILKAYRQDIQEVCDELKEELSFDSAETAEDDLK